MSWIGGNGLSAAECSTSLRLGPIDGKNVEQPASRMALRARQVDLVVNCMLDSPTLQGVMFNAYVQCIVAMMGTARCAQVHKVSLTKGVQVVRERAERQAR